jgi:hypothetical protein
VTSHVDILQNPYLVQGGFQSWTKQSLRIKELKPETAFTILNEVFVKLFQLICIFMDMNFTSLHNQKYWDESSVL